MAGLQINHLGRFTAPWEVCSHRWGRRVPTGRIQCPCPRVEESWLPGAGDTVSLCNRGSGQVASFNQCLLWGLRSSMSGEKRAGGAFVAAPCTQLHSLLGGTTFLQHPCPHPQNQGESEPEVPSRPAGIVEAPGAGAAPAQRALGPGFGMRGAEARIAEWGGCGGGGGQKEPRSRVRSRLLLSAAWLSTDLLIIN